MKWKVVGIVGVSGLISALVMAQALLANHVIEVNGKVVAGKAKTIGGQLYVPVSALTAGGLGVSVTKNKLVISSTAAGGINQTGAQEGKVGDWLFDGVWRFKVHSYEPWLEGDRKGWKVKVELRNGSKADNIALAGCGFEGIKLVMSDDNALEPANITEIRDPGLVQAATLNVDVIYIDDSGSDRKPDRLLLKLNPDAETVKYLRRAGAVFTSKDPSFRVQLAAKE